jgi:endonuclease III
MQARRMKKTLKQKKQLKALIKQFGEPFSSSLGINLQGGKEEEIFKWFLASVLFGKRISYHIAAKTYEQFESCNVLKPKAIANTGWDGLVKLLDDGGYVRYDFSTASKLLDLVKQLQQNYGTLTELHKKAANPKDLENRLTQFKGIGPVTANIFLRELRAVWKKSDPEPLDFIKQEAAKFQIDLNKFNRKTKAFIKLEAALIRSRKQKNDNSAYRAIQNLPATK